MRQSIRACLTGLAAVAVSLPALPALSEGASQTVDVVAVIEPELGLTVEPDTGSEIDFGTIASSPSDARWSDPVGVTFSVFSNLGSPYHVTQHLVAPMTNARGTRLSPGQLQVTPVAASAGVPADEPHVVFVSDAMGKSAREAVSYRLRVPPGQDAGTYRGTILMTVTAR
ncbi:MAG TPA: hypothetical protein VGB20_00970 [bacterium]